MSNVRFFCVDFFIVNRNKFAYQNVQLYVRVSVCVRWNCKQVRFIYKHFGSSATSSFIYVCAPRVQRMMSHGQRARRDSERCQSDALDDAGRKTDKKKSRSLRVRHKATTASRCSAMREREKHEGRAAEESRR